MRDSIRILTSDFNVDGHTELRIAAISLSGESMRLVGTASVRSPNEVTATIYQLHIVNGWRGKGIGSDMVKTACQCVMDSGAKAISAIVEENGPVGFWAHLGFVPVHIEGRQMIVSKPLSER